MSSARVLRRSGRRRRSRALPEVSRLTVRPREHAEQRKPEPKQEPKALPGKSARLGDALRASREALLDIQRQLDVLLASVRAPRGRPAADSPERLRRATKQAVAAMARLAPL